MATTYQKLVEEAIWLAEAVVREQPEPLRSIVRRVHGWLYTLAECQAGEPIPATTQQLQQLPYRTPDDRALLFPEYYGSVCDCLRKVGSPISLSADGLYSELYDAVQVEGVTARIDMLTRPHAHEAPAAIQ